MSYAQRVKYLAQHKHFPLDDSVSDLTPFFLPDTNVLLLPNLIEAHISSSGFASSTSCLPLSPKLRQLRIRLNQSPIAMESTDALCHYLTLARATAPGLSSIRLRGRLSAQTNALIASMSSLKSFTCRAGTSLAPTTLAALGTFPALTALHIRADHITSTDLPVSNVLFPALEDLTIHARPALIEALLGHLQPGQLRRLSLDVVGTVGQPSEARPNWPTLFGLIANAARPTLRELSIEHRPPYDVTLGPNDFISSDLLVPLLSLPTLSDLSLDLGIPHALGNDDFCALLQAWPSLERLVLRTPPACLGGELGWQWRPRASLAVLVDFARRAPALEQLELALDTSSCASLRALDGAVNSPVEQHVLRSLCIASSSGPIRPQNVAEYLHAHFPALEHVNDGEHTSTPWTIVQQTLHDLTV